jgi:hypothetical protein
MGRELKRVPLDFAWPIKTIWGGYVNPYYSQAIKCPDCQGRGRDRQSQVDCKLCDGEGELWHSPEARARRESWKEEPPPVGEGFQLWETTSEGSPVSPVFATLEELCDWCATNATTFGSFRASAEQWRQMLGANKVHHREGNMVFL